MVDDSPNPYAPPSCDALPPAPEEESEALRIRREHVEREASLRALGMFLMIGAVVGVLFPGAYFGSWLQTMDWLLLLVYAVPLVVFVMGWGLSRLKVQARTPLLLTASVALLFSLSAIGVSGWKYLGPAAFCVLLISELVSRKGRFVLTPQYAEIIRQTPQVKCGGQIVVNVFVLCGLVFVIAIQFDRPRGGHHPPPVPASQTTGP